MQAYEELRHLGRGAFGEVVLVRRRQDGRLCALKWLTICSEAGAAVAGEHTREVNALQKLHHPGVLRYFGSIKDEEDGGRLGILTEYADAGDLQMVLRHRADTARPLEALAALAIFTQLAAAVQHLHDHNVMHRDLKPSNVLLTSGGELKVGDFGVAKVMAGTTGLHNITCVGSPAYMAPEVVNGERYGPPCDVWSLGVVLYELCSLRKPFNGRSLGEMALRIMSGTFTPLTSAKKGPPLCPALVQLAQPIIDRMLVMDTGERAAMEEVMRSPAVAPHAASRRCCRACVAALLFEETEDFCDTSESEGEATAEEVEAEAQLPGRRPGENSSKSLASTPGKSAGSSPGKLLGGSGPLGKTPTGEPPDISVHPPRSPAKAAEDLSKLPVRELKRRLEALGVPLPRGVSEKSDLVFALQEAVAERGRSPPPPPAPAPRAYQPGDTERALGLPPSHHLLDLPVSQLKWHLKMAGGELSPGIKEKSELVEAVRSALRCRGKIDGPLLEEPPDGEPEEAPSPSPTSGLRKASKNSSVVLGWQPPTPQWAPAPTPTRAPQDVAADCGGEPVAGSPGAVEADDVDADQREEEPRARSPGAVEAGAGGANGAAGSWPRLPVRRRQTSFGASNAMLKDVLSGALSEENTPGVSPAVNRIASSATVITAPVEDYTPVRSPDTQPQLSGHGTTLSEDALSAALREDAAMKLSLRRPVSNGSGCPSPSREAAAPGRRRPISTGSGAAALGQDGMATVALQEASPGPVRRSLSRGSNAGVLSELLAGALQEDPSPPPPRRRTISRVDSASKLRDVLSGVLDEDVAPPQSQQRTRSRGDNTSALKDILTGALEEDATASAAGDSGARTPQRSPGNSSAALVMDLESIRLMRAKTRHLSQGRKRPPPLSVELESVPPEHAPGPPTPQGCRTPTPPPLPPAGLDPALEFVPGDGMEAAMPSASCQRDWLMTASTALGSAPGHSSASAEAGSAADPSSRGRWPGNGLLPKDSRVLGSPPALEARRPAAANSPLSTLQDQLMPQDSRGLGSPPALEARRPAAANSPLSTLQDRLMSQDARVGSPPALGAADLPWPAQANSPLSTLQDQLEPLDMRVAAGLVARADTAGSSNDHNSGRSTGRSLSRGPSGSLQQQQHQQCPSRVGSLLAAAGERMLPDRAHTRSSPVIGRQSLTTVTAASLQGLNCASGWRGRPSSSGVRDLCKEAARPAEPVAQAHVLAARCPR